MNPENWFWYVDIRFLVCFKVTILIIKVLLYKLYNIYLNYAVELFVKYYVFLSTQDNTEGDNFLDERKLYKYYFQVTQS